MALRWRQWWPIVKLVLALAILGAVGWQFWKTLHQLEGQTVEVRWEWLAAGGLVYLIGLCFWGGFWQYLLRSVDAKPALAATARTYFIGHLGKYVPGKAWSLLMRTGLLYEAGVRPAVGALTATYETMTTMAAGALLAAVLLLGLGIELPTGDVPWGWTIGILLVLAVIPILPGVFNPLMKVVGLLAGRAARKFGSDDVAALPRVSYRTFQIGLLMTGIGWAWLGLSLFCVMRALVPEGPPFSMLLWGRCTAYVSLAYVAGFMAIVLPAGLGVREYLLQAAMTRELEPLAGPESAAGLAVVVVLVLRLLWTIAEVMMAGIIYWLPVTNAALPAGSRPNDAAENEPS